MPSFQGGPNYRQPFGKNVYLRGTSGNRFFSRMCAKDSVPSELLHSYTPWQADEPNVVAGAKRVADAGAGLRIWERIAPGTAGAAFDAAEQALWTDIGAPDTVEAKVLQPGTVTAVITSGPDTDKVGPFDLSATDGRQEYTNIIGVNDTFLPTQLLHRDVEIAVVYEASVVSAWVRMVDAAGEYIPVDVAAMTQMASTPTMKFTFH